MNKSRHWRIVWRPRPDLEPLLGYYEDKESALEDMSGIRSLSEKPEVGLEHYENGEWVPVEEEQHD